MNEQIKNILDAQIKQQKCIPTVDDIVKDSALFKIEDGKLNVSMHKSIHEHEGLVKRCGLLGQACMQFGINNVSFLYFPHDDTSPYDNNEHYTICYSKIRHQNFITAPNIHILGGMLEKELREVNQNDIPFEQKRKESIFAGGPQGKKRGEYVHKLSGNTKHIGVLTNIPIVVLAFQLQYLFQINIDGHTMCYDRLYWQMASNSVPVYLDRDKEIVQLHDELIIPNKHYIESSVNNWLATYEDLKEQPSIKNIANNGKEFIKEHFGVDSMYRSMEILDYILKRLEDQQKQ